VQAFASIDPLRQLLPSPYETDYFSIVDALGKVADGDFDVLVARVSGAIQDIATRDPLDRMVWD
jgi:hypothetical protein